MEATGGYVGTLACDLRAAGFRVTAVKPCMSRDFARAMQRRAKTVRIDAATPAKFAVVLRAGPNASVSSAY